MIEKRRRNITLTVRLTEKEKNRITEQAQKAKMNLTDFIVAATNNVLIVVPEDLKPAVSEMKKMGNNINQIARPVNGMGHVGIEEIRLVRIALEEIQDSINCIP